MSVFVGQERQAIVDELIAAFDACVDGRRPQLRLLTAEAGWGKTRIVHEFYGRLQRERQGSSRYWPAELVVSDDVMRARKHVRAPDPLPNAADVLPWLWWGLRCEEDEGGRRIRAIHNDSEQLSAHLAGLIAAEERRSGDRKLWLEAATTALSFVPGVGQFVTGLRAYHSLVPQVRERIGRSLEQRRRPLGEEENVALQPSMGSRLMEVEKELELVRFFVTRELPLVLIVDDAHHADHLTVAFVRELLKMSRSVLIIATGWPSIIDNQAIDEAALPGEERTTVGGMLAAAGSRHDVVEHRLTPLSLESVGRLISADLPAATPGQKEALAEACDGNPLVLRLQLTSGRVRRTVRNGATELDPDELRGLPRRFEQLIAERFGDLNDATQTWLAEAAMQGESFFPTVMKNDTDGVDRELSQGFCREIAGTELPAWRFIERPVHTAVRQIALEDFGEVDRERWAAASRSAVLAWWSDRETGLSMDGDTEMAWCRLSSRLVSVPRRSEGEPTPREARTGVKIARHHSWAARDAGEHEEELAAAQQANLWAGHLDGMESDALVSAQVRLSNALRANNQPERAVQIARAASGSTDQSTSPEVTFDLHIALGAALEQVGDDLEEAKEEIQAALVIAQECFDAEDVIYARQRLAAIYEAMSLAAEARAQLEAALRIAQIESPQDVALNFELEIDLATLGNSSSEVWLDLMESTSRTLSKSHWLWRRCRDSLILVLLFEGDTEQADAAINKYGAPEVDSDVGLLISAIRSIWSGGDKSSWLADLRAVEGGPYSSRSDLQVLRTQQGLMSRQAGLTVDDNEYYDAYWEDIYRQAVEEPTDAVARLLEKYQEATSPVERAHSAGVIVGIVIDTGLRGTWLGNQILEVLLPIDTLAAQVLGLPFRVLQSINRMHNGGEPELDPADVPPGFRCLYLGLRAVAWHQFGNGSAAADDLRAIRELLPTIENDHVYLRVAAAYRTCRDRGEIEVLRALGRLPGGPLDRLLRLTELGNALLRHRLLDDAVTVQREALELVRTDESVLSDYRRTCMLLLAVSLEERGLGEDRSEALDLRRDLLDIIDVEPAASLNRYRYARLRGDWSGAAIAASEHAVLGEIGPRERLLVLNNLAYCLHRLGNRDLAISAAMAAVVGLQDPTWPEARTLIKNLRSILLATGPWDLVRLRDEVREGVSASPRSAFPEIPDAAQLAFECAAQTTWTHTGRAGMDANYSVLYAAAGRLDGSPRLGEESND